MCEIEDCVNAAFKSEIRLEKFLIKRILRLLIALRPIRKIPRHEFIVFKAVLPGIVQNLGNLGLCKRERRNHELRKKVIDSLRILCHSLLKSIVRISLVTEDVGYLYAQVNYLLHIPDIAELSGDCPRVIGHIHLTAEITHLAEFHERSVARVVERKCPSIESLFLCSLGSRLNHVCRKSVKLSGIGHIQCVCIGCGKHVLAKRKSRERKFL